jgi:PPOX class probable F420-dependent enzyme
LAETKLSNRAKELIDGKNFAFVATIMPDGSPHVAPVWVDREGDIIEINSTESKRRYKNLKRDPRVALTITDATNPYSKVVIRGKVIEMSKKGAEDHIDKLNQKYHGEPKYPYHDAKDPRVIIRIRPEHETT